MLPVLALATAGCGTLNPFGTQSDGHKAKASGLASGLVTGSVSAPATSKTPPTGLPPESDLVYARAAAVDVLAKGGQDISVTWENPHSGSRGTVTPVASTYTQDGMTCRDFLASHVGNGAQAWIKGEACMVRPDRWEVRSLRPWTRT